MNMKVAYAEDMQPNTRADYADLPLADTTGKKARKARSSRAAAGFVLESDGICSRQGRLESGCNRCLP